MNPRSEKFNDMTELLGLLCDGELTDDQFAELEQILLKDPEARAYYAVYVDMHGGLSRRWSPDFASRITTHAPARSKRGWIWFGVGSAVAALLLLALTFQRTETGSNKIVTSNKEEETERATQTVAVLLHSYQANWETESLAQGSQSMEPGKYRLRSGNASIQFLSGAVATLEGPAELIADSPWEARCNHGSVRLDVPPQAIGFRIRTPHGSVVDLGTVFGIHVQDEKTEVHVLKGQVELRNAVDVRKVLSEGQAAALDSNGAIVAMEFNRPAFVSPEELQSRAENSSRSRKTEWAQANSTLQSDPTLLIYADFENLERNTRVLPNKAHASSVSDATVIGCAVVEGRWKEKGALEFRSVRDRVRFLVPGQHRSVTLCVRLRVDRTDRLFNSILMSDAFNSGAMHWQVRKDGTLRLGIAGPPGGRNADYDTPPIFTGSRLGQWTHLATVYDSTAMIVKHYLNGEMIAQLPLRFEMPLSIGACELGNWTPGPNSKDNYAIRNLEGRIDELQVFSRALSEKDIQEQYSAGAARK